MGVKLLAEHHFEILSLKGGCTGSSVSNFVKMPHCWKSHVAAHKSCFTRTIINWTNIGPDKKVLFA